ncbi:MAG: TPM domain-containing protein [Bacillota bacterium]|nr:TPM domain-containing protein [Bacillota bacterium]
MKRAIAVILAFATIAVIFTSCNVKKDSSKTTSSIVPTTSSKLNYHTKSTQVNNVYDFASTMDKTKQIVLDNKIIFCEKLTKFNLKIVVTTLGGRTFNDYAKAMIKQKNLSKNEAIFIVDTKTKTCSVYATGTASKLYTSKVLSKIKSATKPYLQKKDYYNACNQFLKETKTATGK